MNTVISGEPLTADEAARLRRSPTHRHLAIRKTYGAPHDGRINCAQACACGATRLVVYGGSTTVSTSAWTPSAVRQ